jgi:cell wall-associated NlpC family hydrolase
MHALFSNNAFWGRFEKELMRWIGTPHKHFQCEINQGADCGLFILRTLFNIGVVKDFKFVKPHSRLWYYLSDKEIIYDTIKLTGASYMSEGYSMVEVDTIQRGDILLFSIGETNLKSNHIAVLMENDKIIHSAKKGGVHLSNYDDYGKDLTHSFRIYQ